MHNITSLHIKTRLNLRSFGETFTFLVSIYLYRQICFSFHFIAFQIVPFPNIFCVVQISAIVKIDKISKNLKQRKQNKSSIIVGLLLRAKNKKSLMPNEFHSDWHKKKDFYLTVTLQPDFVIAIKNRNCQLSVLNRMHSFTSKT